MSHNEQNTIANPVNPVRRIHPIAARRAFGGDPEHPPLAGRIIGNDGDALIVSLPIGWASVEINDPAFGEALEREDLSRYEGHEPVVLLNTHYDLIGLAVGPAVAPRRLAVGAAIRLENGSAVEILGTDTQPGWLIFGCRALSAEADPLARLLAEGRISKARRAPAALPRPLRLRLERPVSALLDELREDSV